MMILTIDRRLEDPVYEQVANQLRGLIASSTMPPGTQLPSVRQLAGDLGVNLNTIARAYRLLADEGFLVIQDRTGAVVKEPARQVEDSTIAKHLEELRTILARLRQAGMTGDELLKSVREEIQALVNGANDKRTTL